MIRHFADKDILSSVVLCFDIFFVSICSTNAQCRHSAISENSAMKYSIISMLLAFFLFGCSLQKRQYMNGYYSSHGAKQVKINSASGESLRMEQVLVSAPENKQMSNDFAGLSVAESDLNHSPAFFVLPGSDKPCDTLLLFNGTKIVASILSISDESIDYKPCGSSEGKVITLSKTKINKVFYSDGKMVLVRNTDSKGSSTSKKSGGSKSASGSKLVASSNELDQKYVPDFAFLAKVDLNNKLAAKEESSRKGSGIGGLILTILVIVGLSAALSFLLSSG
jgi:hypothetical protein